jgi:hypothetical protein
MVRLGLDRHLTTGSGGAHVYIEYPRGLAKVPTLNHGSAPRLGSVYPAMDVRGDGGYAVFCGRNEKGPYIWNRPIWPDPCTPALYDLLREIISLSPKSAAANGPRPPRGAPVNGRPNINHGHPSAASADPLVAWALRQSVRGRNNAGFSLACQLRDSGLYTESEAASIMLKYYVPAVSPLDQKGNSAPYTEAEALASVRQAYRMVPRGPCPY